MDALELTRELLRFNTINPPGDEQACATHLGRLLEDAGFAVAYHELAERRASLIAPRQRRNAECAQGMPANCENV